MKKRGLLSVAILSVGLWFLGGCSDQGLDTYDESQCDVYFGMENHRKSQKQVFVDTTVFSFGEYKGVKDTILMIRVNALGGVSSQPRTFEFEVVDSLTNAVEGAYYTLEGNTGIIPPNSTFGYIPVHVFYQDNMKNKVMWYLVLQLKPNKDFGLSMEREYVDKANGKYVELLRHWIGISSRVQKPDSWYKVSAYYLEFSSDKYHLINELCHLTKTDWDSMQFYVAEAYWVAVRNYLQVKINAGTPVMEQDDRTGRKQIMKVKGLTGI